MARAALSIIAGDRPGIVDEVSDSVYHLNLSIEDSSMSVLGGEFAALMLVSGDAEDLARLHARLEELSETSDLVYLFRETGDESAAETLPYRVRVVAMDHPGIVNGIAGFFAGRGMNIRELRTETRPAPHTATPLFDLTMTVEVPAGTKIGRLRSEFEAFCDERDLDGAMASSP